MSDNELYQYKKVFITGAAGFIGKALSDKYRAAGAQICGIDFVADESRGIVVGDLSKPGAWAQVMAGCDLVIHTAAVVSNVADPDFAWKVNSRGTADLVDLAAEKGVKRFLHLSSTAAFAFDFPADVTEDYALKTNGNPYVDTKISSEHAVLARHARGDMDCTIVRPADVYGPGSRPWVILPLEMLKAGQFTLPAHGQSIFSPVYVDDLLEGIVLAAGLPAGAGQIFTLSGGIGISCEEFFGNHNRWLGKKGKVKSVSTAVAKTLATLIGGTARFLGRESEMGVGTVDMLDREHTYSIERAKTLLGYNPGTSLEEGMRRTEEWARAEGLL